ncbi:uncharacterized protein LOC112342119 [Selaginella moellendorffii]|uniref:uncharacterized protein LOC112342119 n=1 Tax=Selaginella moellendorffii TaxID=88036 RepID=UPI000D1CEB75|nr:uncharacterized protein LOC112342119 [Selaginella moellendorffii]|eukprot:XP_024519192.1 uncharacterized protein LOC112342119 [Selaginella moellendorffii]
MAQTLGSLGHFPAAPGQSHHSYKVNKSEGKSTQGTQFQAKRHGHVGASGARECRILAPLPLCPVHSGLGWDGGACRLSHPAPGLHSLLLPVETPQARLRYCRVPEASPDPLGVLEARVISCDMCALLRLEKKN